MVLFFFARLPACSLIISKMVGSIPALNIDLYFVPSLSLHLIDPRRQQD